MTGDFVSFLQPSTKVVAHISRLDGRKMHSRYICSSEIPAEIFLEGGIEGESVIMSQLYPIPLATVLHIHLMTALFNFHDGLKG